MKAALVLDEGVIKVDDDNGGTLQMYLNATELHTSNS